MMPQDFHDCLKCGRFAALVGVPYCDSCVKDLNHQLRTAGEVEGVLLATKISIDIAEEENGRNSAT